MSNPKIHGTVRAAYMVVEMCVRLKLKFVFCACAFVLPDFATAKQCEDLFKDAKAIVPPRSEFYSDIPTFPKTDQPAEPSRLNPEDFPLARTVLGTEALEDFLRLTPSQAGQLQQEFQRLENPAARMARLYDVAIEFRNIVSVPNGQTFSQVYRTLQRFITRYEETANETEFRDGFIQQTSEEAILRVLFSTDRKSWLFLPRTVFELALAEQLQINHRTARIHERALANRTRPSLRDYSSSAFSMAVYLRAVIRELREQIIAGGADASLVLPIGSSEAGKAADRRLAAGTSAEAAVESFYSLRNSLRRVLDGQNGIDRSLAFSDTALYSKERFERIWEEVNIAVDTIPPEYASAIAHKIGFLTIEEKPDGSRRLVHVKP